MAFFLSRPPAAWLQVTLLLLSCGAPAVAGEFSVNPIRLDLRPSVRSGAIGVRNDDKERLSFQLQMMRWTQDADGKDQYSETNDLIYFPKILSVDPGQEAVVRVGAKATGIPAENTYRLFIEEMPATSRGADGTAQVKVLVRFGAPIFIAPLKAHDGLTLDNAELSKGTLRFSAANTGNRHQVVQAIELRGTDPSGAAVYSMTLADRYLLAGTTKTFTTSIPPDQCARIATLVIDVKTDKTGASRTLTATPAMCR